MLLDQIKEFIEFDKKTSYFIEPEFRYKSIKENLFDIINTYNPEVIVKAGLGNGRILLDIAQEFRSYILVVEPSLNIIRDFYQNNKVSEIIDKIHFVNGDFHNFPVDYYAADLLICIDYLNIFDSSKCLDEFKRAIQFKKIFFYAGVVLNNDDIEGIYDDFMRLIFPLHNDFYLLNDLITFLELKGFEKVKNILLKFERNLEYEIDYFKSKYKNHSKEDAFDFLKDHEKEFRTIYEMDKNFKILEPYLLGIFIRKQPE